MYKLITINTESQFELYIASACYKDFDVHCLNYHEVDSHFLLVDEKGHALARCSLWWQAVPNYKQERLGVIGHFYSENEQATHQLLKEACQELKRNGCTLAVGPMDGNTWRRYRFVSERGTEPAFFLEPDNLDHWPLEFQSAGFEELANYTSALSTDLTTEDARIGEVREKLAKQGIRLREIDMSKFELELEKIYALSLSSFVDNFLYTPIAKTEFLQMYAKVKPYVNPQLTLLAERSEQLIGYVFALPDLLQAQQGQATDAFIVKTVAVSPDYQGLGIGGLLVAEVQKKAYDLGFRRVIHALMYEANKSQNISGHYAQIMRRYSLYSKALI